ncbi:DUF624 domain-containing protein [Metabacillus iocasae]|uniref:Membrane protein YesL n=1 Tax=Priestia iocasae TaxID=2291674 RepID=A0ABS2QVP0_9BACI|nr:putative membrane protein YesL [Metabacillus iocasae]
MTILNSKLYKILESFSNLLFLNLLWLFFSLPIITLFPSTMAMFYVIKNKIHDKNDFSLKQFFISFKKYCKQYFLIGLIWNTALLIGSFNIYLSMTKILPYSSFFLFISLLFYFFFISISVYLFPILVTYNYRITNSLKNALFMMISFFPSTIFIVFILFLTIIILYYSPITFIIIFSLSSYIIYQIFHKKIHSVAHLIKAR